MSAQRSTDLQKVFQPDHEDLRRLLTGEHYDPHQVLGAHLAEVDGEAGIVVRAFHPEAESVVALMPGGEEIVMSSLGDGLHAAFLEGVGLPLNYRLRFEFPDGEPWEQGDPYRFPPTVGEVDRHLFNEGSHRKLWQVLGARHQEVEGIEGVAFAVWAPNARRVSVVGDFCQWDGRLFPMRSLGASGIFELFIPDLAPGALYKFEIRTADGDIRLKTDPYARAMEKPPSTASRVYASSYRWNDQEWMAAREDRTPAREPMSIYEAHLGSWARVPEDGDRFLTYREAAEKLVAHMKRFNFTHLELMPISEHPFAGSWGYQVSGYYAPTARHGDPDDFRYLVDRCHQEGIGVILDWVPAHFPKDDFALRRFDGTALYEYEDPRRGEHPDWGTLIFNYGRNEVRNFLLANALYWLEEFHIDGLRVDAVASMLYLDYSREEGEWLPNIHGGREHLEAVEFLKELNQIVGEEVPGVITIAEESTAWPGISKPVEEGGLGFSFKWNMGWMHDTLTFFSKDPVHRKWDLGQLTFAMVYEYSERFVMPLSHDEVVHGKGSLLEKMPGDAWQKFANLRLLLSYQFTRPGKKLLFMGTELAPWHEWNHDVSLDWDLLDEPAHAGFARFLTDLGGLYQERPALWQLDHHPEGFQWVVSDDKENSVIAFLRRAGDQHLVTLLNLTPVPREPYRLGVPAVGSYQVVFSSDRGEYGGSDYEILDRVDSEPLESHGFAQSIQLKLPPLGSLVLAPAI